MNVEAIDLPLQARVHRVISPAFSTRSPELWHDAMMTAETRAAMREVWDVRRFPFRTVDFYVLNDVYVADEGLVFDARGRVYDPTIAQHSEVRVEAAAAAVRALMRRRKVPGHRGAAVLCKKVGSANYGHWLLEMWPRVILARQHIAQTGLGYVVQDNDGPIASVLRDCLALAGIDPADVVRTTLEPAWFETLILLDGLTEHGQYMSPLAIGCLEPLIARIPAGHREKLYVTRRGARLRRFQEEDAIMRVAEEEGFAVIDPGEMSVLQQIGMFKGARRVAGIAGAGLTNASFMPTGGRVDLFVPASMQDNFFWFISQIRGHRHGECRCEEIDPAKALATHGSTWHADLLLAPEEFRKVLRS